MGFIIYGNCIKRGHNSKSCSATRYEKLHSKSGLQKEKEVVNVRESGHSNSDHRGKKKRRRQLVFY